MDNSNYRSGSQELLETELNDLLSESEESVRSRAEATVDSLIGGERDLVLYGAGTLGRSFLAGLRRIGIEPLAFADETPSKLGSKIDGLQVFSLAEAAHTFGDSAAFVVTICNAKHSFAQTKRQLSNLNCSVVVHFLALAWKYPHIFLPYYQFDAPYKILKHATDIHKAFSLLSDEESRRQFIGHLKFRLFLDFEILPSSTPVKYFPQNILPALGAETVFVDCGAFDGDTIKYFLQLQGCNFKKVIAFEPDAANFRALEQYVASLNLEIKDKLCVMNYALGAHKSRVRFNALGGEGSSLSVSGDMEVDMIPLDEILAGEEPTFIKFDIEGLEQDALRGGQKIIKHYQPILAVSVYHLMNDLWQIPLYLHSLNEGYKMFLRTEGEDGMGTVCYAVPHSSSPK